MTLSHLEPKLDCDVIIIGAGLSGAAAAYYMAKAGLRVTVLEKQRFPNERFLSHLVSPGALRDLQEIGVASQPQFQEANAIDSAAIYLRGKELITGSFPEVSGLTRHARIIPRRVLDGLMVDAARSAGATVLEGVSLLNFAAQKDWVIVAAEENKEIKTFRARLLVGADGSNSLVARLLRGAPWSKVERAVVARAYVEGITGSPSEANLFFDNESFPGYGWLFPTRKNEANVGVGLILGANPPAGNIVEVLKNLLLNNPAMSSRLKDAKLIGDIEVRELNLHDSQAPIAGDRVVLIGSAAGLVNPFNGEGLQMGIHSAKWATETAMACMKSGDFSSQALATYPKKVEEKLGYGFRLSELTLQLIRNRNLNRAWLKWVEMKGQRAKTDPQFAYLAGGIFSGMIFPNEGDAAKILAETLEDAAITAGLTVLEGVTNPFGGQQSAADMIQVGSDIVQYAFQNPFELIAWCTQVAVEMAEVASLTIPRQASLDGNFGQGS